ncbi:MAG: trypsin-like serine protease [Clostridia bacterium]|nr:trypsin-like serine protease [Clostridia bacterium]
MVTASTILLASPGLGYDGVVRISVGGYFGTGVLLHDGRTILTSAHLLADITSAIDVRFETIAGEQVIEAISALIHPEYDPLNGNHDLALIWLGSPAPMQAERYALYRDIDEVNQVMTMVGYGATGTGSTGANLYQSQPSRTITVNRFEADAALLTTMPGTDIVWQPAPGSQLLADFDNGLTVNDALGVLLGLWNTGEGDSEGLIAPGDSGGPAFIGHTVAGIASYTARLYTSFGQPDIDSTPNSSFGEIGAWQRVSAYQQWIDQATRAMYADVPTSPAEVEHNVQEGDAGTVMVYFLLQFTGERATPEQILQVDFATRDGSARAGEDYLAVTGTLKLYPSENQAVIPVEIISDTLAEPDETFYMDIFNPVGGSFGEDIITLTAVRSIIDDDALT